MYQGKVSQIWRYPVKSLQGESLESVQVNERGLEGDRIYAVRKQNGKFGSGKNTRRFRRIDGLLELSSFLSQGSTYIKFPCGSSMDVDSAGINSELSKFLGETLAVSEEGGIPHMDDGHIHLVTSESLKQIEVAGLDADVRRFRPNFVLDLNIPDGGLIGKCIELGDVAVEVTHQAKRCRMVAIAQFGLKQEAKLLRHIHITNNLMFGVYGKPVRGGHVKRGQSCRVVDQI